MNLQLSNSSRTFITGSFLPLTLTIFKPTDLISSKTLDEHPFPVQNSGWLLLVHLTESKSSPQHSRPSGLCYLVPGLFCSDLSCNPFSSPKWTPPSSPRASGTLLPLCLYLPYFLCLDSPYSIMSEFLHPEVFQTQLKCDCFLEIFPVSSHHH